ncbi:MAG: hypothetical protein LBH43_04540, partial [Treponema sp.]|nr:hypothetical protein [Treponema sp.]
MRHFPKMYIQPYKMDVDIFLFMVYSVFMDILVKKGAVGEELGVSLATINNWIKTNVIPNPDIDDFYSQETFESIITNVKNDSIRLSSRANRSLQGKKEMCYLGITDKKRKKLLDDLVSDFECSNLSNDEGILALTFTLLRSNNLIEKDWHQNNHSKVDILLSDWSGHSFNQKLIKDLYSEYNIPNCDD